MKVFERFKRRMPFFESVSVYSINGKLLICPSSRTLAGLSIEMEVILPGSIEAPELLGSQIIAALAMCKDRIPDVNLRNFSVKSLSWLFEAGGETSWRSFQRKTLIVNVRRKRGEHLTTISSLRREGSAHVLVEGREIVCNDDPYSVGTNVLEALKAAE